MTLPTELSSADALCATLGIGAKERQFLLKHSFHRYTQAMIPKRRGGVRILLVPENRLKTMQRKLLPLLETLHTPRSVNHGFVKNRSAKTNADAHQKRPFLLNIDLKDFFGSITRRRIVGLLGRVGLSDDVIELICALCVTRDCLPQGAATSPLLANMISYRLDNDIMRFAKENRLRYTRYADDISLSAYQVPLALFKIEVPPSGKVPPDRLSDKLNNLIVANGFQINADKVWYCGPKSRREVTGLIVNEFTNVKRRFIRNVRASLHKIDAVGFVAAQADHQKRYSHNRNLENIVRGQLEWIAQVRGRSFDPYRTYAKQYNALFPGSPKLVILPKLDEVAERAVWILDVTVGENCFQGTAVFVQGIGLVSADHVLIGLPSGQIAELYHSRDPSKKFKVTPSAHRCETRDLVILNHSIPDEEYLSLPVASYPAQNQDKVAAIGYADFGPGDESSNRGGQINAHATKHGVKMIEVSAILTDGMSGGPILNDKHEVIAIIHKGGNQEHKQLAVHVSELINLAAETPS